MTAKPKREGQKPEVWTGEMIYN